MQARLRSEVEAIEESFGPSSSLASISTQSGGIGEPAMARMSRSSRSRTLLQLVATVLLVTLQTAVPSSARFMVLNSTQVRGRGVSESTTAAPAPEGFAVDLMQFHHVSSPYAKPNISLAERIDIAVKSSRERAQFFSSQIMGQQKAEFGAEAVLSSPLYSGQGSYIMQISLGTPARKFVAIADTGSDLVWVQCSPCTQCFSQPDTVFNPTASSSYKTVPCTNNALCSALPTISAPCSASSTCVYSYSYGDQSSTQGDFASETVSLTTTTGSAQSFASFGFGCGHKNQGTFQATDGLVGLGKGPLSLVAQLGSQIGNIFSYCLVDFYSATSKTSPLLLGSAGTATLSYTPLASNPYNPTFYYVTVTGITVAGQSLSYPAGTFSINSSGRGGFILDSGTTITQLQSAAYSPLLTRLSSLINYPTVDYSSSGFDLCYDLSTVASPVFPPVVFKFQNLDVALPSGNLFLEVDNIGTSCLAIQSSNLGIGIFGNVQQQNFQIAYDLANQRVGFAPKTC